MSPPLKGVDDSVIEYAIILPYAVPNYAISYTRQEIGIDVGNMRSVSHAPNCFVIESFLDELAAARARIRSIFACGCSPRSRATPACSNWQRSARAGAGRRPGAANQFPCLSTAARQ